MKQTGCKTVIAIDVSGISTKELTYSWESVSGWRLLWNWMSPWKSKSVIIPPLEIFLAFAIRI